jgi:hypothetical protein
MTFSVWVRVAEGEGERRQYELKSADGGRIFSGTGSGSSFVVRLLPDGGAAGAAGAAGAVASVDMVLRFEQWEDGRMGSRVAVIGPYRRVHSNMVEAYSTTAVEEEEGMEGMEGEEGEEGMEGMNEVASVELGYGWHQLVVLVDNQEAMQDYEGGRPDDDDADDDDEDDDDEEEDEDGDGSGDDDGDGDAAYWHYTVTLRVQRDPFRSRSGVATDYGEGTVSLQGVAFDRAQVCLEKTPGLLVAEAYLYAGLLTEREIRHLGIVQGSEKAEREEAKGILEYRR